MEEVENGLSPTRATRKPEFIGCSRRAGGISPNLRRLSDAKSRPILPPGRLLLAETPGYGVSRRRREPLCRTARHRLLRTPLAAGVARLGCGRVHLRRRVPPRARCVACRGMSVGAAASAQASSAAALRARMAQNERGTGCKGSLAAQVGGLACGRRLDTALTVRASHA
jgi:hypothetical protein